MTFLEIAQRLRREARVSGTGPASVMSQTGEMQMLVEWVQAAYQDIQNMSLIWEFLRTSFSFNTIATVSEYTPIAAGLTELLSWRTTDYDAVRCYLTATGVSAEQIINQVSWDEMRSVHLLGSSRSQTGQPVEFAIKPDKSIIFFPIPDAIYTIVGEYYKQPQTLSADADIPIIPVAYHMLLVWLGLRYSGAFQAAPEKYTHGETEYKRLIRRLRHDQLPNITIGRSLA